MCFFAFNNIPLFYFTDEKNAKSYLNIKNKWYKILNIKLEVVNETFI